MTNKKMIRELSAAGLSENASKVYCALLSMSSGSIAAVAQRSGLHRAQVYAEIDALIDLSLVSSVQKGRRTMYIAEDPQALRNILARKAEQLDAVLPELSEAFAQKAVRPTVRFFSGKQGVTEVYKDLLRTLKKGDVFYRYESPKDYKKDEKYLPKEYHERMCDKREVEKFVITNETTWQRKPKQLERYVKTVPSSFDLFEYNVSQIIYADKVAFIDFDAESAWIVESVRFATFQRQLFKLFLTKL